MKNINSWCTSKVEYKGIGWVYSKIIVWMCWLSLFCIVYNTIKVSQIKYTQNSWRKIGLKSVIQNYGYIVPMSFTLEEYTVVHICNYGIFTPDLIIRPYTMFANFNLCGQHMVYCLYLVYRFLSVKHFYIISTSSCDHDHVAPTATWYSQMHVVYAHFKCIKLPLPEFLLLP